LQPALVQSRSRGAGCGSVQPAAWNEREQPWDFAFASKKAATDLCVFFDFDLPVNF
jgi:hypothetical protein